MDQTNPFITPEVISERSKKLEEERKLKLKEKLALQRKTIEDNVKTAREHSARDSPEVQKDVLYYLKTEGVFSILVDRRHLKPTLECLTLRLVSKSFKSMVDDDFLQRRSEFSGSKWYLDYSAGHIICSSLTVRLMQSTIDAYLQAIRELHPPQLPILSRSVKISEEEVTTAEGMKAFYEKVDEFFQICGSSVNGLLWVTSMQPIIAYDVLRRWLPHLPNLKAFIWKDKCLNRTHKEDLLQKIEQNPLPFPPSLMYVHEGEFPGFKLEVPSFYQFRMLEPNSNIVAVDIGYAGERDNVKFSAYSKWRLEYLGFELIAKKSNDLLGLAKFIIKEKISWPLKKVELGNFREKTNIKLTSVSPFLRHFKETLEEVLLQNITIDFPNYKTASKDHYLDLPKVKKFRLGNLTPKKRIELLNIDFMAPMESLETLVISNYKLESNPWARDQFPELIKFRGYHLSLEESNLFQCFPALKGVMVRQDKRSGQNVYIVSRHGSTCLGGKYVNNP